MKLPLADTYIYAINVDALSGSAIKFYLKPVGQDITTGRGIAPEAENAIANADQMPEGTTYAFKDSVDTTTWGPKMLLSL